MSKLKRKDIGIQIMNKRDILDMCLYDLTVYVPKKHDKKFKEWLLDNIHLNCVNYNKNKDYCLKFFEENVSEKYELCREYSEFDDEELSRKWSN